MKITADGFLAFVLTQTGSIDNTSWSTCALGRYLESEGIEVTNYTGYIYDLVPIEHRELVKDFCQPYYFLDIGCRNLVELLNEGSFDTYEELSQWLQEALA